MVSYSSVCYVSESAFLAGRMNETATQQLHRFQLGLCFVVAGDLHAVPVQRPGVSPSHSAAQGARQVVRRSAPLPDRTHGRRRRVLREYRVEVKLASEFSARVQRSDIVLMKSSKKFGWTNHALEVRSCDHASL